MLKRIPESEAPFTVPAGSIVMHDDAPHMGGDRVQVHFGNGRGASVIRHSYTYGGPHLWELAVLKYEELDCTTPITGDVLGWLNEDDVAGLLVRVHALPHVSSVKA